MKDLALLAQLVSIPSETGSETKIVRYIATKLNETGFEYMQKGSSLIGKIVGKDSNKAFILNGHIDTVPVGNEQLWQSDPYTLTLKANKAIGLGVTDMKAGLVVMLEILQQYTHKQPPCDLWFMFAEKEEIDGSGTQKLIQLVKKDLSHYSAVGGVILEPTAARAIALGHKGNVFFEVNTSGKHGHSSQQMESGQSALAKAAVFVNDLPHIQQEWKSTFVDPVLGNSTINATGLSSPQTAANVIPSTATVRIDLRFNAALAQTLMSEIERICAKYDLQLNQSSVMLSPYGICNQDSQLYKAVRTCFSDLPLTTFGGSTDQCFFAEAGINMIIYGPGDPTYMHQPNEAVDVALLPICEAQVIKLINVFSQM